MSFFSVGTNVTVHILSVTGIRIEQVSVEGGSTVMFIKVIRVGR